MEFGGIYSALINTFDDAGAPALEAFEAVIDHNIEKCGVAGLYVNGSTGENFNLPFEYKKTFLRRAALHTRGRVKLIAQIGCNVVEEVYELAALAAECGYDAVSAVAPTYYVYSGEELIAYYTSLADRSPVPLVIYNIPVRTSVVLSRDDFSRLLSHKNIAGVKFTSNDFYLLERIRGDFPRKALFSGFDEMLLSAAVLGTDGAIGTTYNIIGGWAKKVFDCARSGEHEKARLYQKKINDVIDMLFKTGLIPTLKAVFSQYDINAGSCRPPMAKNGEAQYKNAKKIYEYIESNYD